MASVLVYLFAYFLLLSVLVLLGMRYWYSYLVQVVLELWVKRVLVTSIEVLRTRSLVKKFDT